MQKYKIEISDLAEQDLEFVADYIAFDLKNPPAAVNTVRGIRKQINKLQSFPERNDLDDDSVLANLGVRMDYYKNYKIYYVVADDVVIIIRILHMLVDSRAWLYRTFGVEE
ncbi:MAG: type II toxin-antitoxin system RelE/ParE family toxin [Lachnospiraceae bacterium]|nr:type II toxin-antitoxin system RelE/ParE family toxin [Lachnospiraceae bacterium]